MAHPEDLLPRCTPQRSPPAPSVDGRADAHAHEDPNPDLAEDVCGLGEGGIGTLEVEATEDPARRERHRGLGRHIGCRHAPAEPRVDEDGGRLRDQRRGDAEGQRDGERNVRCDESVEQRDGRA